MNKIKMKSTQSKPNEITWSQVGLIPLMVIIFLTGMFYQNSLQPQECSKELLAFEQTYINQAAYLNALMIGQENGFVAINKSVYISTVNDLRDYYLVNPYYFDANGENYSCRGKKLSETWFEEDKEYFCSNFGVVRIDVK